MALIHIRMFGYAATIVMHVVNIVAMADLLENKLSVEARNEPRVQFYVSMQYRFYTCWNFFMQIIYAILALTCDVLILKNGKGYELPRQLKKSRDCIFSAIVWPCTIVTFSFFWSLFYIDRDLIMPEVLDVALTPQSNHVIHTVIVPVVLLELLCQPRYPPKSHRNNIMHLLFHHLVYVAVMLYSYYENGKFMYPIFDQLFGTIYFYLLYVLIFMSATTSYYLHWTLAGILWGRVEKKKLR